MSFAELELPKELKLSNGKTINLSECQVYKSKRNIYEITNETYAIGLFKEDDKIKAEITYLGLSTYTDFDKEIKLSEDTVKEIKILNNL
jgi:hypothetical protein